MYKCTYDKGYMGALTISFLGQIVFVVKTYIIKQFVNMVW